MLRLNGYSIKKWMFICGNILLLFILPFTSIAQKSSLKPNIIYIYADDLGYGELSSYGQTKIKTPNLDQFANEGMRFTQHYSGSPVCAPSRSILMTGKHSGHSYIRGNYELGGFADSLEGGQMPLHEGAYTVAKMLKERGYNTGLIGKWGMGVTNTTGSPLKHGFDYYYGYLDQKQAHNFYPTHLWENDKWDSLNNHPFMVHGRIDPKTATDADFNKFIGKDYAPAKMTQKALSFLDKNKNNPFYLYLPFPLPHLALQAPEEYVKKYVGMFDEKPYYGENGYAPCKYPLSTYAAMITYLDDQVGAVMRKVKELGLDNNTIIMFSSDNGTTFSAGVDAKFFNSVSGLRGLKMDLYEGGIRVPFLARWPNKIKANTVSNHVSGQFDIMATLAEITGNKITNTDGISILPELLGKSKEQQKHGFLYFEYPENGGQLAVRIGNWKGVKLNVRNQPNAKWQLFDLEKDRNESTDIASLHPQIIAEMNAIVKREHAHPHILDWEFIDSKVSKNKL